MKVKIRTQYLFEGLENRYETLQKILKHNFGIAESNDQYTEIEIEETEGIKKWLMLKNSKMN